MQSFEKKRRCRRRAPPRGSVASGPQVCVARAGVLAGLYLGSSSSSTPKDEFLAKAAGLFLRSRPPHPSSLPEGQEAPWEAAALTGRGKRMRSLRVRTVSTASSSTASSCPGHAGRTGEAKGERGALAAGPRPLVWNPGGSRVSQGRARAATFSAETVATRGPRPFPPVQRPPPAPRPTEGDMGNSDQGRSAERASEKAERDGGRKVVSQTKYHRDTETGVFLGANVLWRRLRGEPRTRRLPWARTAPREHVALPREATASGPARALRRHGRDPDAADRSPCAVAAEPAVTSGLHRSLSGRAASARGRPQPGTGATRRPPVSSLPRVTAPVRRDTEAGRPWPAPGHGKPSCTPRRRARPAPATTGHTRGFRPPSPSGSGPWRPWRRRPSLPCGCRSAGARTGFPGRNCT